MIDDQQVHRNSILFSSKTRPYVFKAFINAPSDSNPYHKLHGGHWVAIVQRDGEEIPTTATVFDTVNNITVHEVPLLYIALMTKPIETLLAENHHNFYSVGVGKMNTGIQEWDSVNEELCKPLPGIPNAVRSIRLSPKLAAESRESDGLTELSKEHPNLEHLKTLVGKIAQYIPSMSYNDSYFGEPPGLLKSTIRELEIACVHKSRFSLAVYKAADQVPQLTSQGDTYGNDQPPDC